MNERGVYDICVWGVLPLKRRVDFQNILRTIEANQPLNFIKGTVNTMLIDYIRAAMKRTKFEQLRDGTVYGSIPGFSGVWANAKTEAACRRQLRGVLEEWILLGLKLNHPLPIIEDMDLNNLFYEVVHEKQTFDACQATPVGAETSSTRVFRPVHGQKA